VKLLTYFAVACGVVCIAALTVRADATIEGAVALPKAGGDSIAPSRYQNKTPGEIGPPPPPVAVVYLEGNFPPGDKTNLTVSPKVLQEHFRFLPGVLPVRTGTAVEFPNLDDSYHNVFSYSKAKRFDLGRYSKDEKPAAVVFDKPGVIKLFCEIHDHMRATVLVLDTPHFTRTDTNGTYRLEHLPAGKYTLKVWLDEKSQLERPVELTDGTLTRIDFTSK